MNKKFFLKKKQKLKFKSLPMIKIDKDIKSIIFWNHQKKLRDIKNSKIKLNIRNKSKSIKKLSRDTLITNNNNKIINKINEIKKSKSIKNDYWNLKKIMKKSNFKQSNYLIQKYINKENEKIYFKILEIKNKKN